MTGSVLLIGVGAMVVLGGMVAATATLLGVHAGTAHAGTAHGGTGSTRRGRVVLAPIHAAAVLVGLLGLLLTGWVAVAVGAAGAVLLVPTVLARTVATVQIARLEALGAWTRRLADLLSSGAASSLERALSKSAAVAPAAITAEVAALAARMGPQGTRAALLGFAREMADPVSDEVVMSLILQLRHGGRGLAAVLTDLAGHVEDQVRMRRDVEADRAKPRSNVRTLVLLTVGLTLGFIVFDRSYLAPFSTLAGQLALGGVVAIFAVALLWLRSMIGHAPGVRLLVDADFAPQAMLS